MTFPTFSNILPPSTTQSSTTESSTPQRRSQSEYNLQREPSNSPREQARAEADEVSLSERAQRLQNNTSRHAEQPRSLFAPVPVGERPSPEQSADVILGFIDQHLQGLADNGANKEKIEQAFQQALQGFQQGLAEAKEILSDAGLLTDNVSAGIDDTEQRVLDGVAQLRNSYLGAPLESPEKQVSSVVQAYSAERTESLSYVSSLYLSKDNNRGAVGALAASYMQDYQRNQRVDLQVKTLDGDSITLNFNSRFSSTNSSALAATSNTRGAAAVLAYQRNASLSSDFSFSVEGDLDAGELEALNKLLQQVSELADEFFNGDFETAFATAMAFEMDSSEFSSLSVDLAQSTRASIVESYAVAEAEPAAVEGATVGSLVEQLMAMLEQAKQFAEPQRLLTALVSNQLAQQSLLADQRVDLA